MSSKLHLPTDDSVALLVTHSNFRISQQNTVEALKGKLWMKTENYYEEFGKPTLKVEVMKYLKGKQYVDAKDFAGECKAVVVLAKLQDVQGSCKYGGPQVLIEIMDRKYRNRDRPNWVTASPAAGS